MTHTTTPEKIRTEALTLSLILALKGSPIGVKIVQAPGAHPFAGDQTPMRFCQALMRARYGEKSLITGENITCPAAARAFGFKPLPEPLQTGKGLVGFGIVSDEKVAQRLKDDSLCPGFCQCYKIFPLDSADEVPDIIIMKMNLKTHGIALPISIHTGENGSRVLRLSRRLPVLTPALFRSLKPVELWTWMHGCRDATDMGSGKRSSVPG